jgi:membrane-associated phospholipid phosphatase
MPARGGGIGFTFSAVGAGGVRVKARCGLYAAIPSLHAGYAFLCFLFVLTLVWKTRWRWCALFIGVLYPLAQSWAVVYTGNHYVIDLLMGYLYALAALVAVNVFWRRRRLPR